MEKRFKIDFARTSVNAYNHLEHIREGVMHASANLYSRYGLGINLETYYGNVIICVTIPDEDVEAWTIKDSSSREVFIAPAHLRGISRYLLTKYPEEYKPLLVGNRLFIYDKCDYLDGAKNLERWSTNMEWGSIRTKLVQIREAIDVVLSMLPKEEKI